MNWSEEFLYNKARTFMQRASNEDASSELFPFWFAVSLELLCRAAIAKKHPVLLADPREEDNLLYACGETIGKSPKSVPISTVITRCQKYIPRFDASHAELANKLMELRNAELHSGEAAFHALAISSWQPDYYALVEVLLDYLGRAMEDYLGSEITTRAKAMLDKRTDDTRKSVMQRISKCKDWIGQLNPLTIKDKQETAQKRVDNMLKSSLIKECKCPACGSAAVLQGQVSDSGEPKLVDSEIVVEKRILPKSFHCYVCDLQLNNFAELHIANLGAIYSITETEDPIDYFGIIPEEHVDTERLIQEYAADMAYNDE